MLKRRVLYAAYITCVLAGVAVLTDVAVMPRLGPDLPREIQLMGFYAYPGSVVDDTPISAMGFAGDTIAGPKRDDEIRVLTLGGSAMFNRRMAQRIKEELQAHTTRPVTVVGGALRTHTSMSSVLKYRALAKYDFDIVLVYHGINDLWANHVEPDRFEEDYGHLGVAYERGFLIDRSLIARSLYSRFVYDKMVPFYSKEQRRDNAASFAAEATFRRNLRTIVDAVRRDGGTPVLMTFAWSIPDDYSEEAFAAGAVGYVNPENYDRYGPELWGLPEYVREGLSRHNRIVRELSETEDVVLLDQEMLIGKDLALFGDPCHLNDEGTGLFVRHLSRFLSEKLPD